MPLTIRVVDSRAFTKTISLEGRLDNQTVVELDKELDRVLEAPMKVLVFDLEELEYISSAGIRSIFKAQKRVSRSRVNANSP